MPAAKTYEAKKKEVEELVNFTKTNNRKPSQQSKDVYERKLANLLNRYQKSLRGKISMKVEDDLYQILINNDVIKDETKAQEEDYNKKKEDVLEIINWSKKNKRRPNQYSKDPLEKKLANRLNLYQKYFRHGKNGTKLYPDLIKLLLENNLITEETKITTYEKDGKTLTTREVADNLNTTPHIVRYYYDKYQDIDRTIEMIKYVQNKKTKKDEANDYSMLAREFRLSKEDIESIKKQEEIKKANFKVNNHLTYQGISLHKYCLLNKLNYSSIYYKIIKQNMNVEEAIKDYIENGSKEPLSVIYKNNNRLFKYVSLQYGFYYDELIDLVKSGMSIPEAITYASLKRIGQNTSLRTCDYDYLYDIILNFQDEEYFNEEVKDTFNLRDFEWKILKDAQELAKNINNDLILFELSINLNNLTKEEIVEYLNANGFDNEDTLKKVFFNQGTIFDEEHYDNKKDQEIKRAISAIGEDWQLLSFKDNELNSSELSMKNYIKEVVKKYNIDDIKIKYYIDLSNFYKEVKEEFNKVNTK